MEVHHHSHTARKKWTHYLWEFLMLFLAVFCGFLAENQREHYIEHQREKKYAKQLLSDLRKDSAFFARKEKMIKNTFSGQEAFKQKIIENNATDADIVMGFLSMYTQFEASLTNTTFNQMKSSGALRYIRNDSVTNALTHYYDVTSESLRSTTAVSKDFLQQHLAPWYLAHIRVQDLDALQDTSAVFNPRIINRSPATDQQVLNLTENYKTVNVGISEHMDSDASEEVNQLIRLIKNEYHLK